MPRIKDAIIPDEAEGKVTSFMACHLVTPRARAPFSMCSGTASMASSATEVIVGRAMNPRMIEGAKYWPMLPISK